MHHLARRDAGRGHPLGHPGRRGRTALSTRAPATTTPPADSTGRRPPAADRDWIAFVVPVLVLFVVAAVMQRELFTTSYQAWGDAAVNGFSVLRAERLEQFVGNYSRVGFHHPGPAFMYVLAAGEILFFHVLGIVPAPYNGQLLGASLYVAISAGAVCVVVRRLTASWTSTALVFCVLTVFVVRTPLLGQDWFPLLYISAFLVMMVAGVAVAAGRTAELPIYVLAAGVTAQGHASFLMFVAVTTAAVSLSWWSRHRGGVRQALARHRVAWRSALAVVGVLCLPALADLVTDFPGEWPAYLRYTLESEREPRTWGEIFSFFSMSWSGSALTLPVCLLGLGAGLLLLLTERDHRALRAASAAWGMLGLQTVLYLYYLARGVDFLSPPELYAYVGFFYMTVPLGVVLVAVVHGWWRLSRLPGRARTVSRVVVGACALAVAAQAVVAAPERAIAAGTSFDRGAAVTVETADASSKPVVLTITDAVAWPTAAGLALALERRGADWCITGPNATPIMFEEHVCDRRDLARGFSVEVTDVDPPAGATVLWQDVPTDPRTRPGVTSAYVAP